MVARARGRGPRPSPRLLVAVGIALMLAPSLLGWARSLDDAQIIQEMSSVASDGDAEGKEACIRQAEAYNASLGGYEGSDVGQVLPYEEQLRYGGMDEMCWVEAPSVGIRCPVYHGTGDDALAAGVGHLEGTSLPVGGRSSHCVLTAHSGLATSRGFDDIRGLGTGDRVVLHVLDRAYAYEVTGSEVVLPDEASSLSIERGQDLLTLVTCTPYGVNDHRLLVHCRRCVGEPSVDGAGGRTDTTFVPMGVRVPAAAIAAVAGACVVAYVPGRERREPRRRRGGGRR